MRRIFCAVMVFACAFSGCEKAQAPEAKEEPPKLKSMKLNEAPVAAITVEKPAEVAQKPKAPEKQLLKVLASNGGPSSGAADVLGSSDGNVELSGKSDAVIRGRLVEGDLGGAIGLSGQGVGGAGMGIANIGTKGGGRGYASGHGMLAYKSAPVGAAAFGGENEASGESYGEYGVNPWVDTEKDHLSTFAADVDTASYTVARRKLIDGSLPPKDSVRVEEWLNYFRYNYPQPNGGPLSVSMDAAPSPFSPRKHLLRVGIAGKQVSVSERKIAHLTFLVDVSGSMSSPDKLPLAKRALRMLVDNLRDGDTVSLVTYAGNVRVVLPPTGMEKKAEIHEAIANLSSGGSTAMASGIELAYQQAVKTLDSQSLSRVIILSDGDANVGSTSPQEILKLIEGKVKEGVTVTTVGFGMGNYQDSTMEQFANKGNGNHYYCDSLFAARRIFVEQLGGTLEVIAQDVKFQVDFDPTQVKSYRLVGYENRDIADRDFRNDKVDAGEIGSGHQVTALYELELKDGAGDGMVTVRVRAKQPRGTTASESAFKFQGAKLAARFDQAPADFRFATAVMGAAEIFRRSAHASNWSYPLVQEIAGSAMGESSDRREFVELLKLAAKLGNQLAAR